MTDDEVANAFGFNPDTIGNRNRGWWIVDEPDEAEKHHGIEKGFLCVRTRDGGANPICTESIKLGDCVTTVEDDFDGTYRYYYYRPIRAALGEEK